VAFSGRLLTLVIDRFGFPDGTSVVRELVLHPGASAILPILPDERILFVEQFRAPIGTSLLEIPAGKLEPGEDPLHCAQRELREETGYVADRWTKLSSVLTTPGFSDERIHLFLAEGLRCVSDRDAGEIERLVLLSANEAFDRLRDGLIEDAKTARALLTFDHRVSHPR
jgi:ADP-ribose pyrophosphatase